MRAMEVSVILANRNDTNMLLMTVLSAVEELRGLDGEVVVVDNSDQDRRACVNQLLAGQVKDGTTRILYQDKPSSAAAMDKAAREARGKYIFYVDSHCMIGRDTLRACLRFFRRHEGEPIAFCHAPIQWAHNSAKAKKASFRQHRNILGSWGKMVSREQKITWKGMPHMIRKDVYEAIGGYGCLAEHHVSWGGLIPYLGIKPWLLGYENWGIPHGVAYHFGEYPNKCREFTKYRLYGKSGDFPPGASHAVSAYVFGGEQMVIDQFLPCKMERYFASPRDALAVAIKIGGEEREWMLANQKCSIYELMENPPWGKDF